jgi:very-short-patch-repair endonuclease
LEPTTTQTVRGSCAALTGHSPDGAVVHKGFARVRVIHIDVTCVSAISATATRWRHAQPEDHRSGSSAGRAHHPPTGTCCWRERFGDPARGQQRSMAGGSARHLRHFCGSAGSNSPTTCGHSPFRPRIDDHGRGRLHHDQLTYVPFGCDGVDTLVAEHRRPRDTAFIRVNRTSRLPEPVWWIDTTSPGANADHDAAPPWWVPGDPLAPSARRWTIPIAPAARAAIDAVRFHCLQTATAADLDAFRRHQLLRDVRALLCEVVQRLHCSVDDLLKELAAAPQRGSALANRALEDVIAGCRSTAECDLRDFIRSCRFLPEPRWNQPLPGFSKVVPDACWPEARLVVEVDSVEWHQFGDAPEKTARRHALYAALGWRVFPVSPHRLRTDAVQVRRELVTAYRSGLAQA